MGYGKDSDSIGVSLSQYDLSSRKTAQTAMQQTSSTPPRTVTLIGGQPDETPSATSCTITPDTVNYKVGTQGWKMTMSAAVTAQFVLDPPSTEDPMKIPPSSAIGLWVYIPDVTKVNSVIVDIYSDSALSQIWERGSANLSTPLQNGWNLLRWAASNSTLTDWGTIHRMRVYTVVNAATEITLGRLWAECPEKAQLIIVNDWGAQGFYDKGYPDLLKRGIPVTWAINPGILGTQSGDSQRIDASTVAKLAKENNNSISFHSWDVTPTQPMTGDQILADCMKCIKWLERNGYFGGQLWRPAWVQNEAPNHNSAKDLFLAYATYNSSASINCFPPINPYNIPRMSIHGPTSTDMDTTMASLKTTHGLAVMYTHSISEVGGQHTTPDKWNYFVQKLDQGMAEGWLECVTLEQLMARSGVKWRQGFGDWVAEVLNYDGSYGIRRLP